LVQIVVSLKSTVGFVPNFKKIQFTMCRISSQKFSIIGFFARELHWLEVEGVHGRISVNKPLGSWFK
jgi:hypothetical protein